MPKSKRRHDDTGLCIMTDRGWKLIGGAMKPVIRDEKFGAYPEAVAAHKRLVAEFNKSRMEA